MSRFRRAGGQVGYQTALDVTAVHFARMHDILESWPDRRATVRFDTRVLADDLRHAAAVCGLTWREDALKDAFDAQCKHHEPAAIDHPAQQAFARLAGLEVSGPGRGNRDRLLADAALRETLLHEQLEDVRRALDDTRRAFHQSQTHLAAAEARLTHLENHFLVKNGLRFGRRIRGLVSSLAGYLS